MSFWNNLRVSLFGHLDSEVIDEVRRKLSQRPQLDSEAFAKTYFPEEKREIAQKLWKITKEHSVADVTGMTPEDMFVEDLRMDDLDSLSLVEYLIHIEKDFGISIEDEKAESIRTFRALLDEVYRLKKME